MSIVECGRCDRYAWCGACEAVFALRAGAADPILRGRLVDPIVIIERGKSQQAWWMLTALAVAEFFGMTLWFSATAVTPALVETFNIPTASVAWLTMAVQAGFVVGTLAKLRLKPLTKDASAPLR
jgi:hypothetical protein